MRPAATRTATRFAAARTSGSAGAEYVAWRQENNDRIKLVADKDEYKIGDTAEVLIPSPYQGKVKALVTIERGNVISHQVIDLSDEQRGAQAAHHRAIRAERVCLRGASSRASMRRAPPRRSRWGWRSCKVSTEPAAAFGGGDAEVSAASTAS